MIDDDTIWTLYQQRGAACSFDPFSFARAVYALGRDAGLAEAQRACEPYGKVGKVIAISIGARRALTENEE